MKPHIYGSCHFEDCPVCERIAESEADDLFWDADSFGWGADLAAEREAERGWRWSS